MIYLPYGLSIIILSLLFHISFIHLISLPSSFSISPRSFLSLSLISPYPLHVYSIISVSSWHILHLSSSSSVQYLFSLSSFPHLNLVIIFLSLALSLPRYNGTSSAMHLSYSLLYVDSLILSLLSCLPYICPSRSSPHASALCLSTSSPSFLYSTQTVSCTLSFRPFVPRTLPLSVPLSFSVCSSCSLPSLFTLVFLCSLLAPTQIFLLHSLHLLPFLPSPDLSSLHQHALYHALEHHHSPHELTSLRSLSYSPNASNYLVRLPHYLSHLRLVRHSLVEGVPKYLNPLTLSILLSSHFHSFSSLFLFLLLNTIIFVFSIFTSSFFFLTYFPRFLIILLFLLQFALY
jgi:hypothetical protein